MTPGFTPYPPTKNVSTKKCVQKYLVPSHCVDSVKIDGFIRERTHFGSCSTKVIYCSFMGEVKFYEWISILCCITLDMEG